MRIARLFVLVFVVPCITSYSQQGVVMGNFPVHSSAVLDMSHSNKGLLIPRLTQGARVGIANPAEGLMVYETVNNRFYQYNNGSWVYMVNNASWAKSSTRNFIFTFDSIGLGNSSPDARLRVTGNMRGRGSMYVSNGISANGTLRGNTFTVSGAVNAGTYLQVAGNITSAGNVTVNNASPLVQFKSSGVNKVFVQEAAGDLRLGTNSGNTLGKTIIRMNGSDIISIDTNAVLNILTGSTGGGNIVIGTRVTTFPGPGENMLPVVYGKVTGNGTVAWMSTNGVIMHTDTGIYDLESYSGRVGPRSSIIVSAETPGPLICTVSLTSNFAHIRVDIVNAVTGLHVDADFNFIICEPLNLFD